jgi:hypothetical protein
MRSIPLHWYPDASRLSWRFLSTSIYWLPHLHPLNFPQSLKSGANQIHDAGLMLIPSRRTVTVRQALANRHLDGSGHSRVQPRILLHHYRLTMMRGMWMQVSFRSSNLRATTTARRRNYFRGSVSTNAYLTGLPPGLSPSSIVHSTARCAETRLMGSRSASGQLKHTSDTRATRWTMDRQSIVCSCLRTWPMRSATLSSMDVMQMPLRYCASSGTVLRACPDCWSFWPSTVPMLIIG